MPDERTAPAQGTFWPELVAPMSRPAAAPARPLRLCRQCGQPIPAPTGGRVYCSPACRELARPPRRAERQPEDGAAPPSPHDRVVPDSTPARVPEPAVPSQPALELTPHRRLVLAWQLLSAQRPAALWQALTPDEQAQAAALTLSLYQWVRELEPFARRHRGSQLQPSDAPPDEPTAD
jgi:predicted nucleic acid-binding Zn ribbon protein